MAQIRQAAPPAERAEQTPYGPATGVFASQTPNTLQLAAAAAAAMAATPAPSQMAVMANAPAGDVSDGFQAPALPHEQTVVSKPATAVREGPAGQRRHSMLSAESFSFGRTVNGQQSGSIANEPMRTANNGPGPSPVLTALASVNQVPGALTLTTPLSRMHTANARGEDSARHTAAGGAMQCTLSSDTHAAGGQRSFSAAASAARHGADSSSGPQAVMAQTPAAVSMADAGQAAPLSSARTAMHHSDAAAPHKPSNTCVSATKSSVGAAGQLRGYFCNSAMTLRFSNGAAACFPLPYKYHKLVTRNKLAIYGGNQN